MSVNTGPRGYSSEPDYEVLKVEQIDSEHSMIITDNSNGKVSRIYIGNSSIKVGQMITPVANVGIQGANIEYSGFYNDEQSYDGV